MLTGQKQPFLLYASVWMDVRLNQLFLPGRCSPSICSQERECRDARECERLTEALKTFHITRSYGPVKPGGQTPRR